MRHPVPGRAARDCLRRLSTPHALDFGTRLLHRGSGGVISFREFLAVARDFVRERPEQTAVYLAALVALDMSSADEDASRGTAAPSAN
jgi:hypothetical protein